MLWLIPICFAIASYFWLDAPLALFIHAHVPKLFIYKIASLTIAPLIHLFSFSLLTLISLTKRLRPYLPLCLHFFILIVTIFAITGTLKIIMGRARPDFFIPTGFYGFRFFEGFVHNFRSFPSSHAAAAFGLAYLWSKLKHKHSLNIYFLAILLTSTRLLLRCHFLSDILAGAMVGILSAKFSLLSIKQIGQVLHLSDKRLNDS